MIIEAREDVISLQGRLDRNHWASLRAVATITLRSHPQGIILDCSRVSACSPEGLRTFREAIDHIAEHKWRIIVTGLPVSTLQAVRQTLGIRSQMSIAATIEEARQSLAVHSPVRPDAAERTPGRRALTDILVPIVGDVTADTATLLARHLARVDGAKVRVHLVYVLEVPRVLPMNAPLPEDEARASLIMEKAQAILKKEGFAAEPHVTRARDVGEEIVSQALEVRANMIVLAYAPWLDSDESGNRVVKTLFTRSPCEIVLSRPALPV